MPTRRIEMFVGAQPLFTAYLIDLTGLTEATYPQHRLDRPLRVPGWHAAHGDGAVWTIQGQSVMAD